MHNAAVVIMVLCSTVAACARPTEMAELAGTYVLSIETDTLHLASSGRYTRVYRQIGAPNRVAVDTGRWRVSNNRRMVALAGLPQRWPEHGRFDPQSGTWHQPDTLARGMISLAIGVTWAGAVTLGVKPEIGWQYRRVRQEQSGVVR